VRLLAIDPGAISGALAMFPEDGPPYVWDIPVVDGQIDAAALHRRVKEFEPNAAVVEWVASMPKQGVASTFKFGVAFGIIQGVLAANEVPVHLVKPAVWKKAFHLAGKDKEAARALAIRLYPGVQGLDRKKDAGRAEALLLGRHYWQEHIR